MMDAELALVDCAIPALVVCAVPALVFCAVPPLEELEALEPPLLVTEPAVPSATAFPGRFCVWVFANAWKLANEREAFAFVLLPCQNLPFLFQA